MLNRQFVKLAGAGALLFSGAFAGSYLRDSLSPVGLIASPALASVSKSAVTSRRSADRTKPETEVTEVVHDISPAVVTVGAVKRQLVAQQAGDIFFPSIRYSEMQNRIPYMGSGFLVDKDGYVVTNFHVIEDSESLFVTFPDGREMPATLVDADKFIDIALLKVDAKGQDLPAPLEWADSANMQIGEMVMAFGNPFGNLIEDSQPTVTVGYTSALHRNFRPDVDHQRIYQDMIQTDAAINPGNSGGPLVDINGSVAGVNTFIFSPTGGSIGIGFAIPAKRVRAFVDEVKTFGRLRPLLLDFAYESVRNRDQTNQTGVQVQGLIPKGPAERSGFKLNDVILEADGRAVMSKEDFYILFASKQVGDKIPLKIWRDGKTMDLGYVIEEAKNE